MGWRRVATRLIVLGAMLAPAAGCAMKYEYIIPGYVDRPETATGDKPASTIQPVYAPPAPAENPPTN
jgi:hypothetical protein